MLLEIAVADAYGQCFEWTDKWLIVHKNKLNYITLEENPSLIKPGNYTDDTQMTIAMAEFIVNHNNWSEYDLAQKFVECFHRDPRRGYAPGFYKFLLETKNGTDFVRNIHPNSNRSGAAMRAAPIGLNSNLTRLKQRSYLQSSLTHNTEEGNGSALVTALMVHFFRYDLGAKADLVKWLNEHVKLPILSLAKYDHIPVEGWPCVIAALDAILRSNSMSELLINCVNFAGDTDTIAAIAAGPASLSKEIVQDLPQNLIDGLENGKYGRDYIIDLDKRLLEKEYYNG
jgi:ADP-ribosyl-[dinitrogen reductase] hydrolase